MSELRIENGVLVHGDHRYMGEDCGRVFECLHADEAAIRRDGARVIIHVGGLTLSLPADVAAQVVQAAAGLVADAKRAEVEQEIQAEQQRLQRLRDEMRADLRRSAADGGS